MRRTKWAMANERRANGELVCHGVDASYIRKILQWTFQAEYRAGRGLKASCRFLELPPLTCCVQKTVAFYFEFGPEIFENARYKMQTLYSMENLQFANQALGRE